MVSSKLELVPFDGKTIFTIWQSTIKDVLVQQYLLKALFEEKPKDMQEGTDIASYIKKFNNV